MTSEELKRRTKAFAICVIRLVNALPKFGAGAVIGKQLLRCGTSVGANYRSACRARSRRDFIAKLAIVEEECVETIYWFELLVESGLVPQAKLELLCREANEILAIIVATIRTTRGRANPKSEIRNPKSTP